MALLIITILGMLGVLKFRYKEHLNKLFALLILEVVSIGFLIYRQGQDEQNKYFREASALYQDALQKDEAGDHEKALETLKMALQIPQNDLPFSLTDLFNLRGKIYFNQDLWQQAATAYEIRIEITPNDDQALARLGQCYRQLNRYEEARQIYERARAINPHDYYILNGLQNCLRRLAGFYQEAERVDASDKLFQRARQHILDMISIAKASEKKKHRKILNAEIALARLNWQWKRYQEAIALLRDINKRNPKFSPVEEDLAAITLEFGQIQSNQTLIEESLAIYRRRYENPTDEASLVYSGSGIAEATAFIESPSKEQVSFAENAVLLSIAKNETAEDDPYPFYAAAVLYMKKGNEQFALDYIQQAIRAERKRASNPYTFDYVRLLKYEVLQTKWKSQQPAAKDITKKPRHP